MKTIMILLSVLFSGVLHAQRALDTLYANEKKNVALFFSDPIRQGVTGASHFVFTYNMEEQQYFGLLQAQPGEESNLLVVTDGGGVYSYILKYAEELPRLNYFIPISARIGSEFPMLDDQKSDPVALDSVNKRVNSFEQFADLLLKSKPKHLKFKHQKGIKVQVERIAYFESETYLVMEITNHSGIAFAIDYLELFRVNGTKKRKSSYQKLLLKPLYKYQMPDRVLNSQSVRFVFVFSKFVLGDTEKLQLELQERNGSRKVTFSF